jgi:hypothetical protein
LTKIVQDSKLMINKPTHVCSKTAFDGWPTGSRRISSYHNFLSFNHYLKKKYFKLLYREKTVIMVSLITSRTFILLTCMHFLVWWILRRWSTCAYRLWSGPDCRKFEKHCSAWWLNLLLGLCASSLNQSYIMLLYAEERLQIEAYGTAFRLLLL